MYNDMVLEAFKQVVPKAVGPTADKDAFHA